MKNRLKNLGILIMAKGSAFGYLFCIAELEGEAMLQFRSGDNLYPYCVNCAHSALTPITGVLGCTLGDDPDVMEYSAKLSTDEVDENVEKCPKYTPAEDEDIEDAVIVAKRQLDAGMVKEVPVEIALKEEGLEDESPDWNYDYVSGDENPGPERITLYALKRTGTVEETSDIPERSQFFDFLNKMGVGGVSDEASQKQLITTALLGWRDGTLAPHINSEFVDAVLRDFRAGNWS